MLQLLEWNWRYKMQVKLYDNTIVEKDYGVIYEGPDKGKPGYETFNDVKEVYINDAWVANPGYDLTSSKSDAVGNIEEQLVDLQIKKDKADALTYTTISTSLQTKIDALTAEKTGIEALT